jgi:membrane protein implicated in regulation of membrane protease activity
MEGRYYQTLRMIQLIISSCVLLFILFFLRTAWITRLSSLLIGGGLGYWLGLLDWNKRKSHIDKRNIVILYATDGAFYILLLLLYFIQFLPWSVFTFIVKDHPYIFHFIIGFVCSLWVTYNFAFWRGVRALESIRGRLITKQFWSRSRVGPEGMISRQGIVIDSCDPMGKVQIGPEIWIAESVDKMKIEASNRVIVRDIEELKLIVERIPDA